MTAKARSRSKKQDGFADMRAILTQQREVALGLYEHDLRVGQQLSDDGAEDLIDQANNAYNREQIQTLLNELRTAHANKLRAFEVSRIGQQDIRHVIRLIGGVSKGNDVRHSSDAFRQLFCVKE